MTKHGLLDRIKEHLDRELAALSEAARSAHDAATNAESKAENKYDTRALEASYLAGAQARRAGQLHDMLTRYHNLLVQSFTDEDVVGLTALVEVERDDGTTAWYFLGPCGGGIKVEHEGQTVVVITPAAPLGRQLVGKECGDGVSVRGPAGAREYEIVTIL